MPNHSYGDQSVLSFRPLAKTTKRSKANNSKLLQVNLKSVKKRANVDRQPTPLHDYINFKGMSGNEILINLNNVDNLGQQEMMAGLLELAKRDRKQQHDWNTNPITANCLQVYTQKVRGYNAKRTIQGALMLRQLRIRNPLAW